MPEYLVGVIFSAIIGWGGFTWKRAEDALVAARQAANQVDRVELKMAEEYLTKKDFELYMDRLFDTLAEMKGAVKYVSDRVDYHVAEQARETKNLREKLSSYE
jgi:thioredoxin-like negative regulator of GroEL